MPGHCGLGDQARHQPLPTTSRPAKIMHGAFSPLACAVWKNTQFEQRLLGLKSGSFFASTLEASSVYPIVLAAGSFGSSRGGSSARADVKPRKGSASAAASRAR